MTGDAGPPDDADEAQALTREEEKSLIWAAYERCKIESAELLRRLADE